VADDDRVTVDVDEQRGHARDVALAADDVAQGIEALARDIADDAYGTRVTPRLAEPMARVRIAMREVLAAADELLAQTADVQRLIADMTEETERRAANHIGQAGGSPS
jgi:hypothetical protein